MALGSVRHNWLLGQTDAACLLTNIPHVRGSYRLLTAVGALVLAAIVFQVFFRYEYISRSSRVGQINTTEVVRIDRLTQSSCVVPCLPPGAIPFTPGNCRTAHIVQIPEGMYSLPHAVNLDYATGPGSGPNHHTGILWDRLSHVIELDDGHLYEVSNTSFEAVQDWTIGSTATVCWIKSRIDGRLYFSIESNSFKTPATLVL